MNSGPGHDWSLGALFEQLWRGSLDYATYIIPRLYPCLVASDKSILYVFLIKSLCKTYDHEHFWSKGHS